MTNEQRATVWLTTLLLNTSTQEKRIKVLARLLDEYAAEVRFIEAKRWEADINAASGTEAVKE